jgi:dienelactone hydrolase
MRTPLRNYRAFDFAHDGTVHSVYYAGSGPGVLLIHELPGMVKECVDLSDHLVAQGFTVFLPLLFGEPETRPGSARFLLHVCLSDEFRCLAKNKSSPITSWLRALCVERIRPACPGPGIGAVGMCLTGGFVLSLFIPDVMLAPVMSQPALPMPALTRARKAALGVSPADLSEARESAVPLLGFRFQGDRMCPPERFESLKREFGARFEGHELPGNQHSVLTIDFVNRPDHPTYKARERVVEFLRKQLSGPQGSESPA